MLPTQCEGSLCLYAVMAFLTEASGKCCQQYCMIMSRTRSDISYYCSGSVANASEGSGQSPRRIKFDFMGRSGHGQLVRSVLCNHKHGTGPCSRHMLSVALSYAVHWYPHGFMMLCLRCSITGSHQGFRLQDMPHRGAEHKNESGLDVRKHKHVQGIDGHAS